MTGRKKTEVAEVVLPVVSTLDQAEVAVRAAEDKYTSVVYEVTTVAGKAAADEAKKELTKLRTSIEKTRKELKQPILDAGAVIDDHAKALTARVNALEAPVKAALAAEKERTDKLLAEQEAARADALAEENRKLREQLAQQEIANEKAKAIVEEQQAEEAVTTAKQELFDDLTDKIGLTRSTAAYLIECITDGSVRHVRLVP